MAGQDEKEGWRRRCRQIEPENCADPAWRRLPFRLAVRSALAYGILVLLVTAFFIHARRLPYGYLGWATPLGLLFGLVIAGFDRLASWLRTFLASRCNRAICGFVLFFAYILGYLVLFSLIVTYPVGSLIEQGGGSAAMAMEYGLSTLNVILFFAVLGWLDWGRTAKGVLPFSRHRNESGQASDGAKTLDN
ncbi:MAG: hypothetical protein AB1413_00895 [Thermodesulfobacteriota bacterium]